MSNSHYCQVHIGNNLSQQLMAVFAARETITAYSQTLFHLLVLCCTIHNQYQDLALGVFRVDVSIVIQYPFLSRFWSDLEAVKQY